MRFKVERRFLTAGLIALAMILSLAGLGQTQARADATEPPRPTAGFRFTMQDSPTHQYSKTFTGSQVRGFANNTSPDMVDAAAATKGTIQATFTPGKVTGTQTLVHFRNSAAPAQNASIQLVDSSLRWVLNGTAGNLVDVTVPVDITAGEQHQLHITVERGYLWIFLDASPVYFAPSSAFLSSIGGLNSIEVGGRYDATTSAWTDHLTGQIIRFSLNSGYMTNAQMRTVSPASLGVNGINTHPVELDDYAALEAHFDPAKTDPTNWVITGDSITHGALHTNGYRSWGEHIQARLVELGLGDDVWSNTAISGGTAGPSTDPAIGINNNYEERIGRFNPDVVIMMIGMNDASVVTGRSVETYKADVLSIINKVRADGGIPVLVSSQPIMNPAADPNRSNYPLYVQAMREVAAQN